MAEFSIVRLSSARFLRQFNRQGRFSLLDLPGEVRNKIYTYAIPIEHYAIEWVCNNPYNQNMSVEHCLGRLPDLEVDFDSNSLSNSGTRRCLIFNHLLGLSESLLPLISSTVVGATLSPDHSERRAS